MIITIIHTRDFKDNISQVRAFGKVELFGVTSLRVTDVSVIGNNI